MAEIEVADEFIELYMGENAPFSNYIYKLIYKIIFFIIENKIGLTLTRLSKGAKIKKERKPKK